MDIKKLNEKLEQLLEEDIFHQDKRYLSLLEFCKLVDPNCTKQDITIIDRQILRNHDEVDFKVKLNTEKTEDELQKEFLQFARQNPYIRISSSGILKTEDGIEGYVEFRDFPKYIKKSK